MRLPAAVVQALELREGEEIALHVVGVRTLEVACKAPPQELLTRLRRLRGRLPADFRFEWLEEVEAEVLFTENLQDGLTLGQMRVRNPFA